MAVVKADVGGSVAVFVAPGEADGYRRDPAVEPMPQRWSRMWVIFLACGAVATVGYQLTPAGIGQDLIYQVIGLAGAGAILVGIRRYRPARTLPWYLMAVGQALWSLADAVFSWDATIQGNDRFPSPADPFYILGYPVVALALYLLIRGRRPRRDIAGWLDSAIVTVALALLSWIFLARPTLANYQESPLSAAVAVAYPIGDILIVGLAIRLITTPGGRTASFRLLLTAIAALLTVDTLASSLDLLTFQSTAAINFLWLISYICWGAAALHPTMRDLSRRTTTSTEDEFTRKRLLALTLAVLVAPGTLAAEEVFGDRLDVWAVVIGSVLMFLLVVWRMYLAIDQIAAANRERARAQQALAHQATHDSLTGLPNRAQALRLIQSSIGRVSRTGDLVGLLFIDLDGFKEINDSLGHQAGDEVLRGVAQRMQANVRSGDVVARLGGDEFVVLLEPLDEEASAISVADRLIEIVSLPLALPDGREVAVGASIGVAFNHAGLTDPEALLHEADIAVYRAKRAGRGRAEIFDSSIDQIASRVELHAELRAAIARDELVVHYQPIVHLATSEVQGYEALVRWDRPGTGLMAPGDFIPIAEQSDLICELDRWVLLTAARQMRQWNDQRGCNDLIISVNVSARHTARSRVVADVADALQIAGIGAHQLAVEITETALIDDPAALRHLYQLRGLGVAISIDDFGTGYSSLARLEHLPVDILKIDRAFLEPTSKSAEALLKLIVETAHTLGLEVIAEGIENEEQLGTLRSINCDSGQGYLLGRPADQSAISPQPGPLEQPLARLPR